MDEEPDFKNDAKRRWFEPVAAILMAISSLCTAWCSYQNSRWSGRASDLATEADRLGREAAVQHMEAGVIETVHTRLWMEAMDAMLDGDTNRAQFYTVRFQDELKVAYDKWIALRPLEDPAAPPHPFVRGLYVPRYSQEIADAHVRATQADAESARMGHHAGVYLSNTVLLATVLFFAGTAGRFDQRRVRWASLGFAVVLFLYVAARMIALPVA